MDAGQPRAAQKEHPAGGRNLLLKALAGFAHQRHGLGEDGRHHAADLLRLLLGVALHVDAVDRRDGHLHGEADRVVGPREPLLALHLLGELGHPPLQLVRVAEEVLPTAHLHVRLAFAPMPVVEGAGVELAYDEAGAGPAVVLVHGMAADRAIWPPEIAGARTIAYDRRGSGESGAPEPYARTTVAEQAEDLAALVRALDAAPAVAAGADLGALVVLDVLKRHAGVLRGAVLVDPPVFQLV